MLNRNLSVIFLLSLAPALAAVAGEPVIVQETDQYLFYSDQSVELKQDIAIPHPLTEADVQQLRAMPAEKQSMDRTLSATMTAQASALAALPGENAVPGLWKGFGGVPYGCNGQINAIEKGPDGKVYMAGRFSACNDVIVNNITAWDPATNTFEALGSPAGVNNTINDIEFAPNGDLIVAGAFISRAGSVFVADVARWDGVNWSSVGQDSFNSSIFDIEIDPDSGNIFVGGFFTRIFLSGGGSLDVNRVAMWDGTQWNALGDGTDNAVEALKMVNGTLYAGGRFRQAGGQPADFIAAWNGMQWSPVGGGMDNSVRDLETDGTRVLAGGFFDTAGGVTTGEIAVWDGTSWSSINGPTCCLGDMDYAAGRLVVTGGFNSVDGVTARRVAIWDGENWSATVDESAFSGFGSTILADANDIYIGGSFSVIGTFSPGNFPDEGVFANRIAHFNGAAQEWQAMRDGQGDNVSGAVQGMTEFGGELWVVGNFQAAGRTPISSGLARWDGSNWQAAPGDTIPCGVITRLASGIDNQLFAQTSCNRSSGIDWYRTARFDGTDWQPLDQGLGFSIFDITVDAVTGDAYYAGSFTHTFGENAVAVNRIARWDGISWSPVGEGEENGVASTNSLYFTSVDSVAAYNGNVMVRGFFDRAGTAEVDRLALWDGNAWMVPGEGLNNGGFSPSVNDLAVQGDSIFAAGFFTRSGEQQLRRIAQWDGFSWQPLAGPAGEGIGFTPRELHATVDKLYVGGDFLEAGGRPANRIAQWDGADWRSLGAGSENGLDRVDGTFNPISAMQSTADGIFVGGFFGGSNAVTSPNLIRFVPMENLDLSIAGTVTAISGNQLSYEITVINNGEFALVDASLAGNWSPAPLAVNWSCTPVAPATSGCTQSSGSDDLNQILEMPAGATLMFEVTVEADLAASPFLDFSGNFSAAPVAGATGKTSDSVAIQTAVSSDALFKDDFES